MDGIRNDIDDDIVVSNQLWINIKMGINKDLRNIRREINDLKVRKKKIKQLSDDLTSLRKIIERNSFSQRGAPEHKNKNYYDGYSLVKDENSATKHKSCLQYSPEYKETLNEIQELVGRLVMKIREPLLVSSHDNCQQYSWASSYLTRSNESNTVEIGVRTRIH